MKTPQLSHKRQRQSMHLAPLSICQPAMMKQKCPVMRTTEASYLAPREADAPPNEDLKAGYYAIPPREDQLTQPFTSESSGDDSFPDLIDLQEENQPPPVPPKRVTCPTTLGLDKKQGLPEPAPVVFPTSKGKLGKPAKAVALVTVQPVCEEEIIQYTLTMTENLALCSACSNRSTDCLCHHPWLLHLAFNNC